MHDARDPRDNDSRSSRRAQLDTHFWLNGQSPDSRTLRLSAVAPDNPERLIRYLTGALLASGSWILTRSTQANHSAELEFEFTRASCVEIYSVLIAAGLALSRDSHLQLTDLCHCTRNIAASRAIEIVRIELTIYHSPSVSSDDDFTPSLAA